MNATNFITLNTVENLNNLTQDSSVMPQILSKDEIQRIAPMVYYKEPTNPHLSKYYTMASTETVIDDIKRLGWEVVNCRIPRRTRRHTFGSMHMVVFQNPAVKVVKDDNVVVAYPRIILTNSHDGFCSFRFRVGLYRPDTDTFLIITSKNEDNFTIRHMGYTFEELRNLVNMAVDSIPTHIEVINKMRSRELTDDERRKLALAAIRSRRNDPEYECSNVILDMMLEPTRPEDAGNDLWTAFNIIHEKVMEGMFQFTGKNGKLRKARKITSIGKEISLNQSLFDAAASLI